MQDTTCQTQKKPAQWAAPDAILKNAVTSSSAFLSESGVASMASKKVQQQNYDQLHGFGVQAYDCQNCMKFCNHRHSTAS